MKSIESAASQIRDLVSQARKVLVTTHASAGLDGVAASLALAQSLRSFGKEVILAAPSPLNDTQRALPGSDQFKAGLGPRSLIVSIDYEPGSIQKVSYGTTGNKFNLVVTPGKGKQINADEVDFAYSGGDYNLVIVLDTADPGLLGDIYETEGQAWANLPVINIDRHPANTQFGQVNAIDPEAKSVSEIVARLLLAAKLPFSKETADLLLRGIREATKDFDDAGPGSFEVAAQIKRELQVKETTEQRLVNEPFRKGENLQGVTPA